jgi:hypothetical protein
LGDGVVVFDSKHYISTNVRSLLNDPHPSSTLSSAQSLLRKLDNPYNNTTTSDSDTATASDTTASSTSSSSITHKFTTLEHWDMLLNPDSLSPEQRAYETVIGDAVIEPIYDPNCVNNVSGGCHPVTIISAEHLVDPALGPTEARKLAHAIQDKPVIQDYLVPEEECECLWAELIIHTKGARTPLVRGGEEQEYNFSEEMLDEMIHEYERLIAKYSSDE